MNEQEQPDELARYNMERWDELASADVEYARPMLELTTESARDFVDPDGIIGAVEDRDVLCLASGGGQQSAAFGLLGAHVTVFDLSSAQLARDQQAAAHYGLSIQAVQGDMRDLSVFDNDMFDVVYHAFSINFVPEVRTVHREAARVLRAGGLYRIQWSNPFTQLVDAESWSGTGFQLSQPYVDGRDISEQFPHWYVEDRVGNVLQVAGPHEYVHTLSRWSTVWSSVDSS